MKNSNAKITTKEYLIIILFLVNLFSDPKLLLIYFLRNETLAFSVYILLCCIVIGYGTTILVSTKQKKYFFLLQFSLLGSVLVDKVYGLGYADCFLGLVASLLLPIIAYVLSQRYFTQKMFAKSLMLFCTLNILVYLLKDTYFAQHIDNYTQYGKSSGMIWRFAGLWVAPGVLALFSAVTLAYSSIFFLSSTSKLFYLILVLESLSLGILSGNRSFVITIPIIIILCILMQKELSFINIISRIIKLIGAVLITILLVVFLFQEEVDSLLNYRFSINIITTDAKTRLIEEHGLFPVIGALLNSPVRALTIGIAEYTSEYGSRRISYDGMQLSPSNGYISLVANYGAFISFMYFYVLMKAIKEYNLSLSISNKSEYIENNALKISLIIGCVVSIFDALLFHQIILFLIMRAFLNSNKQQVGDNMTSRGGVAPIR